MFDGDPVTEHVESLDLDVTWEPNAPDAILLSADFGKLSAGSIADKYIKFNSTGQSGMCSGDSGGPDLIGDTDTMIAVNSFDNGTKCSSVDYGSRIDLPSILAAIRSYE